MNFSAYFLRLLRRVDWHDSSRQMSSRLLFAHHRIRCVLSLSTRNHLRERRQFQIFIMACTFARIIMFFHTHVFTGLSVAAMCPPGTYRSTLNEDGIPCKYCPQGFWSKNYGTISNSSEFLVNMSNTRSNYYIHMQDCERRANV